MTESVCPHPSAASFGSRVLIPCHLTESAETTQQPETHVVPARSHSIATALSARWSRVARGHQPGADRVHSRVRSLRSMLMALLSLSVFGPSASGVWLPTCWPSASSRDTPSRSDALQSTVDFALRVRVSSTSQQPTLSRQMRLWWSFEAYGRTWRFELQVWAGSFGRQRAWTTSRMLDGDVERL